MSDPCYVLRTATHYRGDGSTIDTDVNFSDDVVGQVDGLYYDGVGVSFKIVDWDELDSDLEDYLIPDSA